MYSCVVIILFKRLYISQYFIPILLENYYFVFLCFLPALCFEFDVILTDICLMIVCIDVRYPVILFSR